MDSLVAVPGFGFMPEESHQIIENTFQDYLELNNLTQSDLTVEQSDELKRVCPPFWDNASCIPGVLAGTTATLPCMTSYNGQSFSPLFNATRDCLDGGVWSNVTNYGDCLCNSTIECPAANGEHQEDIESPAALEISIIIYLIGYLLSFLALCGALTIYASLREMRCLRHKIHMGLFCAFGLSALNWIFNKSLQSDLSSYMTASVFDSVYCTSWVLTFFFYMASFYWMFIEGLYLFLQVQCPLSLVNIKYKHFIGIGCGGPILNLLIWVGARLYKHQPDPDIEDDFLLNCPFFQNSNADIIFEIPIFAILFVNTFFLIWIMVIVVSKLREKTAMDHDRKHWKAAKALIIVMPILGIGYLITMVGPPDDIPWAFNTFQIIRSILLSTQIVNQKFRLNSCSYFVKVAILDHVRQFQGLVISLPYCYLNTEVQSVIRNHYRRWQLIRNVGNNHISERASVSASTAYTTVNRIDLHQFQEEVGEAEIVEILD